MRDFVNRNKALTLLHFMQVPTINPATSLGTTEEATEEAVFQATELETEIIIFNRTELEIGTETLTTPMVVTEEVDTMEVAIEEVDTKAVVADTTAAADVDTSPVRYKKCLRHTTRPLRQHFSSFSSHYVFINYVTSSVSLFSTKDSSARAG